MSKNTFRSDLAAVINKHSKENGSNTPDFILAHFLLDCLKAFDGSVNLRETHYGRFNNQKVRDILK
jgi:hypothetical protein